MRSRPSRAADGPAGDGDGGSAVAEFVLVTALLLFVTLGVTQLAVVLYARNIAASAAHEGAHVAALADRSLADGEARALAVLAKSLTAAGAEVTAGYETVDGVPSVRMRVEVPIAVVGAFDVGSIVVTAHAFDEADDGA